MAELDGGFLEEASVVSSHVKHWVDVHFKEKSPKSSKAMVLILHFYELSVSFANKSWEFSQKPRAR
jgi:hypothetical protein